MSDYSSSALVEFLEYAGSKGLLNKSTVTAKKIAVLRVFDIADESEKSDVRHVDLSGLMHRFVNLAGASFKPDSLATYQSRVKSSIEEFLNWKQNPIGFRGAKRSSAAKKPRLPVKGDEIDVSVNGSLPSLGMSMLAVTQVMSLPIPIRNGLTVQVNGIPFDLTKAEASKIANVILAMATEVPI